MDQNSQIANHASFDTSQLIPNTTLLVSVGAIPFDDEGSRRVVRVEDAIGKTVADIIGPVPDAEHHDIVVSQHGICLEDWHSTVIYDTSSPLFVDVVPRDRELLQLGAVIAIAVFAPAAAAAIVGASSGFAFTATLGVITALGSYAAASLFGPRPGDGGQLEQDEQRFGIRGTQNSSPRGRAPVLCCMGTHRVSPYLACQPYVYVIDNETLGFRGLYDFGYGPLEFQVDSHKFGADLVSSFDNASLIVNEGVPGTTSQIAEFNDIHNQTSVNTPLTMEDGWLTFSFDPGPSTVTFVVVFGGGLFSLNKKGDKQDRTVQFAVELRLGSDPFAQVQSLTVTAKSTSQVFGTVSASILDPTMGGEVRIARVTKDTDDSKTRDIATLSYVDFIVNAAPVAATGRALVYIQIEADRNLNDVVSTYSAVVTRKISEYSSGSWSSAKAGAVASNPAWLFASILRGPGIAEPVADANIDGAALREFADYCDTRGYRYDGVWSDVQGVWDRLSTVAAAGRATPTLIDALKYSVIVDQKKTVPVDLITPKDTLEFRAVRQFDKTPHAFRATYNDRENLYMESEIVVYAPGYDTTNATDIRAVNLTRLGVTTADEAHKYLQYLLAVKLLRPEAFHATLDIKNVRVQRGDYVDLLYDTILVGVGSGRLVKAKVDSGRMTQISLDEKIELLPGKDHTARFQKLDGTSVKVDIRANAERTVAQESVSATVRGAYVTG